MRICISIINAADILALNSFFNYKYFILNNYLIFTPVSINFRLLMHCPISPSFPLVFLTGDIFNDCMEFIKQELDEYFNLDSIFINYIIEMINYNIEGGKGFRGMTLIFAYNQFHNFNNCHYSQTNDNIDDSQTNDNCHSNRENEFMHVSDIEDPTSSINDIYWLAVAIELLQISFLIADDIMDKAETRRGKLCWYKRVGLSAINDSLLLQALVFRILKKR